MPAFLLGPGKYVLVALVALAALVMAHEYGYSRAAKVGRAELAAYQAKAAEESAKLEAKAAKVEKQVVVEYRDRVREIRVVTPEVIREIEVVRQSDCKLPSEFRMLHDAATGNGVETPAGANDGPQEVDPATVIETVRENYARARESIAQLEALQKWAASVSTP
jgi:hypothetical protein